MREIASISQVKTGEAVEIDDTITVLFDTGKALTVTIKSPRETDPSHGVISYESPLGKALLGKREGESLNYRVAEKIMSARVLSITQTHIS